LADLRQNALVAQHPAAAKACLLLRKLRRNCTIPFLVGFFGVALVTPFSGTFIGHGSPRPNALIEVTVTASFVVLCVSIWGLVFSLALHFLVILFFFARYSLGQLLAVTLLTATCVTAIIALPGAWKVLPSCVLVVFGACVIVYVAAQDPTGLGETPRFIQDVLRARRLKERQKRRPETSANPNDNRRES
jgi:hypothetical protein